MSTITPKNTALRDERRAFYASLIAISLPIIFQNLITQSFGIVDNVMIGQLGDKYIAATGMANQVVFFLILLCFGACSGISIFIAQYWGKQELGSIRTVVAIGARITGVIAMVFFVASLCFPRTIMSLLSPDPEVIRLGALYLQVVSPSFFAYAIAYPVTFAARSVGQPRIAMYSSIVSILINAALNYVLIFGELGFPRLGIAGAAVATLIAKLFELGFILYWTKRYIPFVLYRLRDLLHIPKQLERDVLKRGLPVLLNEGFWSFGMVAITIIISWSSTEAVAAYTVSNVMLSTFQVLSFGIGAASATMLGNALGAGERDKAMRYNRLFLTINAIAGALTGIALYFVAPWIVRTFYNLTPEAAEAAVGTLAVIACALPFKFYNTVMIIGTFRAGGDTLFSMFLELSCIWGVAVPMAWLGSFVFGLPIYWVVLLVNIEELVKTCVGTPRVVSGKWARVVV